MRDRERHRVHAADDRIAGEHRCRNRLARVHRRHLELQPVLCKIAFGLCQERQAVGFNRRRRADVLGVVGKGRQRQRETGAADDGSADDIETFHESGPPKIARAFS